MPVLSNTGAAEKERIKTAFLPFARPDYVEGMLIGDDLDSLLSAMYLHRHFGWQVKAVYCKYTRLWFDGRQETFLHQLYSGRLFAVDLDIYHPSVPSLGHHMIAWSDTDELPGHSHTLNPNAIRGFTVRDHFKRKYPLATIHFLRWLLETKAETECAELLTWLADSAFINAQKYRENMEEWVGGYLSLPAFSDRLPSLQTLDFEQILQERILEPMSENPLCTGSRSTFRSRHLGLNGFQCQFENPNTSNKYLQNLLDVLSNLSGWPRLPFPETFAASLQGKRHEIRTMDIGRAGLRLGNWLSQKDVFSYAFTFRDRMNYTVL